MANQPSKDETKEEKKKSGTELPDPNAHHNDTAGRNPTEIPKSAVHRQPEPVAMADDAMSEVASAE